MRHLDLFSGIGGFSLAGMWVWGDEYENIGHSEVEAYPCKVYHRHFPESECLGDITKIDWSEYGTIDLLTGGFPCQPHSVAGKRGGKGDKRDLWPECLRAVRELRPKYALFENVRGLFSSNEGTFFNRILSDLAEIGYDAEWCVLSASAVGAWHRRDRIWIVAYPNGNEHIGRGEQSREADGIPQVDRTTVHAGEPCGTGDVSNSNSGRLEGATTLGRDGVDVVGDSGVGSEEDVSDTESTEREQPGESREYLRLPSERDWWATEPNVGRVAHGIPSRVDRLKGLGNAIVPQVVAVIMQKIKEKLKRTL